MTDGRHCQIWCPPRPSRGLQSDGRRYQRQYPRRQRCGCLKRPPNCSKNTKLSMPSTTTCRKYQRCDGHKKMAAGKENAYLSQKLARIVTDAPYHPRHRSVPHPRLRRRTRPRHVPRPRIPHPHQHARRIPRRRPGRSYTADEASEPPTETIVVQTQAQLDELVTALNNADMISFRPGNHQPQQNGSRNRGHLPSR